MDQFRKYLQKGIVEGVIINDELRVHALLNDNIGGVVSFNVDSGESFEREMNDIQDTLNVPMNERANIQFSNRVKYAFLFPQVVMIITGLMLAIKMKRKAMHW
ncbi:hypothetical protein DAMA08_048910 [Martiniozyma asiatica (nom. inval.)]|nr:hypothetical protein DAMA08_048910 [Martiniozyma asiatica]